MKYDFAPVTTDSLVQHSPRVKNWWETNLWPPSALLLSILNALHWIIDEAINYIFNLHNTAPSSL
jgi:hypothetical protein